MKKNKTSKKRIIVSLFVLIFSITMVHAQHQGRPQGPPPAPNKQQIEKMVTDLSKELSLTKTQEESVSELYTDHYKTLKKKMNSNKGGKPDRSEMDELKTDFENDVKALLTEDQQKLFVAYLKKQESKRQRPEQQNRQ